MSFRIALVTFVLVAGLGAQAETKSHEVSTSLRMAAENEPGTPVRIRGIVKARDSHQPVAGALLHVYQTDAKGEYSPGSTDDDNPRLAGYVRTDGDGRFELHSVRPGSYQNTRSPGHIHYSITAERYGRIIGEILFEDDPYVTDDFLEQTQDEEVVVVKPKVGRDGITECEATLWVGER